MKQDEFTDKLRENLLDGEQALDELTLAKLKAARMRALEQVGQRPRYAWWLPTGFATAVISALLIINVWNQTSIRDSVEPELSAFDDLQLLSAGEELDMFEDLDFYLWLASEAADEVG